jgi:hypothetical protein|nr:MAG TPA: GENERAL CONTROL PROTEIN GCN4 PROTEIN, ALPHA/BETA COILED COIL.35A [Caudoviricetes sp.]
MNTPVKKDDQQVEILNFQTFTTDYVAKRYGTSVTNIRDHKREHADEILENIHFIEETNKFSKPVIKWTLRGIIKLGMFIRSKEAKNFRSWAEAELEKSIKKIEDELKASRELGAKIKLLESSSDEKYREIYDLRSKLKNERRMSEARYEAISDLKKRLDKNTTPELEELRSRARFLEEELERIKKQIPNGDDLNYYYSLESKVEALQQELNEKEHENFDLQSEKFGYMQGQGKIINDIVAKLETIYAANKTVQDELFYYISALKKSANEPIKYHQLPTIKVKK